MFPLAGRRTKGAPSLATYESAGDRLGEGGCGASAVVPRLAFRHALPTATRPDIGTAVVGQIDSPQRMRLGHAARKRDTERANSRISCL